ARQARRDGRRRGRRLRRHLPSLLYPRPGRDPGRARPGARAAASLARRPVEIGVLTAPRPHRMAPATERRHNARPLESTGSGGTRTVQLERTRATRAWDAPRLLTLPKSD